MTIHLCDKKWQYLEVKGFVLNPGYGDCILPQRYPLQIDKTKAIHLTNVGEAFDWIHNVASRVRTSFLEP